MTDEATAETPIETVTLGTLLAMQEVAGRNLIVAKERATVVAAELSRRYGESAKRTLAEAGKTHGTVSMPLQDNLFAKGEVKQTVSWDSALLQAVAQTLPWERVAALFQIKFSMSETIYKGISALSPELREKIDAARTTKIGEPIIALVKKEA